MMDEDQHKAYLQDLRPKLLHNKRITTALFDKGESNKTFSTTNGAFKEACELVETPATVRQASKFRNKKGKAYNLK